MKIQMDVARISIRMAFNQAQFTWKIKWLSHKSQFGLFSPAQFTWKIKWMLHKSQFGCLIQHNLHEKSNECLTNLNSRRVHIEKKLDMFLYTKQQISAPHPSNSLYKRDKWSCRQPLTEREIFAGKINFKASEIKPLEFRGRVRELIWVSCASLSYVYGFLSSMERLREAYSDQKGWRPQEQFLASFFRVFHQILTCLQMYLWISNVYHSWRNFWFWNAIHVGVSNQLLLFHGL